MVFKHGDVSARVLPSPVLAVEHSRFRVGYRAQGELGMQMFQVTYS